MSESQRPEQPAGERLPGSHDADDVDPAAQLQPRALRANGGGGRDPKGGDGCRGGARRQQQQPVGHERDLCVDAGERRAGHAHRRRHRAPEFHRPLDRRRPGVHADGHGAALGATGTDTVTVSVIDPRTLVTLSDLTVSAGILDPEFDTDTNTDTNTDPVTPATTASRHATHSAPATPRIPTRPRRCRGAYAPARHKCATPSWRRS